MVLLRNLFILQAVRLVLTYDFSNCDLKKILDIHEAIIFVDLNKYLNGSQFSQSVSCNDETECLMKIEHHTLNPIPGCPSLPSKTFAVRTKDLFKHHCQGYREPESRTTQEMKEEVEDICLNQTSQIKGLWSYLIITTKQ
ncbi:thymic stromal lymphopoietin [Meriones unguiculatus]|uniref:thymic stromal lymphopoietin n=1 Tax=Meriones unguiculatus TaxID=10047 RepID=UPI000B4EE980|nr:thymic stromal lymphopoietin [Meriones unguiculatus]